MPGKSASNVRILIADDDRLFRRLMGRVLGGMDGVQIVGEAADGGEAVELAKSLRPHLVTLDLEMPVLHGFETLEKIKAESPSLRVIVVTAHGAEAASHTIKALAAGASDFALKPHSSEAAPSLSGLEDQLRHHIEVVRDLQGLAPPSAAPTPTLKHTPAGGTKRVSALAIASSTGGPTALTEVLSNLPADLGVPVFVVQHMPKGFTQSMAAMLDEASPLKVVEAEHRTEAQPGTVYIAPGGQHMTVTGTETSPIIKLNTDPLEHSVRPAADVLLRGMADVYCGHTLVAVLTGMGRDGATGAGAIAELGGQVVVQDKETSTVWGMPGAVVQDGVPCSVLPLNRIGPELARIVRKS